MQPKDTITVRGLATTAVLRVNEIMKRNVDEKGLVPFIFKDAILLYCKYPELMDFETLLDLPDEKFMETIVKRQKVAMAKQLEEHMEN